jgi:hypothetical protein
MKIWYSRPVFFVERVEASGPDAVIEECSAVGTTEGDEVVVAFY